MIGLKEIYRHRSSSDAKIPGNEKSWPPYLKATFQWSIFFHLCRHKYQNPEFQHAWRVYQEVLSKTEVLHLWSTNDKNLLFHLEKVPEDQLDSTFQDQSKKICTYIFHSKTKTLTEGIIVTWVPFVQSISLCQCVVGLWVYPRFISNFVYICV